MRRRCAAALGALLCCLVVASAGAAEGEPRYTATVRVEGSDGPRVAHIGDVLVFFFRDRQSASTRYRLCVTGPTRRRACKRTSARRVREGRWMRSLGRPPGRYVARWAVRGRTVRKIRFDVVALTP